MAVLAHIGNLGLECTERPAERARRVMDYLRALPRLPDALLITGDIAEHGDPAAYEEAVGILDAPFPVLSCPGNHDIRDAYNKALLHHPDSSGPVNAVHHIADITVLMADSTIPNRDDGRLAPATLGWISDTLDALDRGTPAILALHHPPAVIHQPGKEQDALQHPEELAELLAASPNILAVLAGHSYVPTAATFAGRPLLVAPPTTWTGPVQAHDQHAMGLPPQLAIHFIEDRHIATQFLVLP